VADLVAMPSVTLAFSKFCATDADICSTDAPVRSTPEACSVADCDKLCAVSLTCPDAEFSASTALLTSVTILESFSTVSLVNFLSSPNAPSYGLSIVLVRSPSETAPITRTTSAMLSPVVVTS
jgi:hypothetical protein